MRKSVDIVGAGIAGLSVGCYLQMNGYRTQIFEQQELPGGLCTSWTRAGYTFDNCVQWLLGSAPGVRLHDAWQELGALPGPRIVDHDEFVRVVGADGATLVLYTDVDRLERHLHELAPEDGHPIRELTNLIRRQVGFDFPLGKPRELMTPLDRLKAVALMLPSTWSFVRYGRVSLREFASRFRSPFLREALTKLFDLPDFPLFGLTMPLAWMHKHVAGYPVGGSLEFIRGVEQRYCDLGGRIHFHAPVTEILVEPSDGGRSRAAGGSRTALKTARTTSSRPRMATARCTECSTGSSWTNNCARCTTRARSSRRSCACRSAWPATFPPNRTTSSRSCPRRSRSAAST